MQAATISMDRTEARHRYLDYLKDVRSRQAGEIATIKNCYRELSRGKLVLDLVESMRRAGTDHRGYPRLAIVRAQRKFVKFYRDDSRAHFVGLDTRAEAGDPWRALHWMRRADDIHFKAEILPQAPAVKGPERFSMLVAQCPLIPPQFRPPTEDLKRYRLLFEPVWERVPPVDPILLKPLGGNMYLVCAQWDLTEVERAVLAATA